MAFVDWLCIIFIVLKLTHVIDWHWAIVLSPELIRIAIYIWIFRR